MEHLKLIEYKTMKFVNTFEIYFFDILLEFRGVDILHTMAQTGNTPTLVSMHIMESICEGVGGVSHKMQGRGLSKIR